MLTGILPTSMMGADASSEARGQWPDSGGIVTDPRRPPRRSPTQGSSVSVALVEDADGYERAVNGAVVRTVRLGAGTGPNSVASTVRPGVVASAVQAGFPMAARGDCFPDRIYVAAILDAPPGTRWCGHDMASGDVLIYGPSKRHTAVNPTGARFAFGAIDVQQLKVRAVELKLEPSWQREDEMRVCEDHERMPFGS